MRQFVASSYRDLRARQAEMDDETQTPASVDPIRGAIEPLWRNIRTVWKFYWKMAWQPRQFAAQHIRTIEKTAITEASQHFIWLAGCYAALVGFLYANGLSQFIQKLLQQVQQVFKESGVEPPLPFPSQDVLNFELNYMKYFIIFQFILTFPMAAILWLITRRQQLSFSRSLLIFMHPFNLTVGGGIFLMLAFLPVVIYAYLSGFSGFANTEQEFQVPLYAIIAFITWLLVYMFFLFRVFIVGPNLIAGTLDSNFWHGFRQFYLSAFLALSLFIMLELFLLYIFFPKMKIIGI
jgi:hypothetical protein